MRLEQLYYVIVIADCKSVSKAAKMIYISQPALSNSIKCLEAELGFPIFDRILQGVILTSKGEELYKIACSIQQNLDRINILSKKSNCENELCIGAVPMAWGFTFIDIVDSIKIAFPGIRLTVNELRPTKLWDELQKEHIRVAICSYTTSHKKSFAKMVSDMHLINEPLMECPMMVFFPTGHPLANENVVSLDQLKSDHIYCFQNADQNDFNHFFNESLISYMSDRSNIKEAVAHGKGIAFLPATMVLDDIYIECGKIKAVPLKENAVVNMELIHHNKSLLTEQETTILEIIRSYARKMNKRIKNICGNRSTEAVSEDIDLFY